MRSGPLTLSDLKPGDRARIESIDTRDPAVQRLMVLGLVEGAEVTFLRGSLGGDPLEFRIYGAAISLRREQARSFEVAPMAAHGSRVETSIPLASLTVHRRAVGTIAVVGNPNAGKSSVFNRLTGLRQRTANYPGVTVERRLGRGVFGEATLDLVDLPGTYSLSPDPPTSELPSRCCSAGCSARRNPTPSSP